jgi:hypothetical protein
MAKDYLLHPEMFHGTRMQAIESLPLGAVRPRHTP